MPPLRRRDSNSGTFVSTSQSPWNELNLRLSANEDVSVFRVQPRHRGDNTRLGLFLAGVQAWQRVLVLTAESLTANVAAEAYGSGAVGHYEK
jgi:hypothetical protein